LISLRILNAVTNRTFFQPDEYFQSLEPAWDAAFEGFGNETGAWVTWVSSGWGVCFEIVWGCLRDGAGETDGHARAEVLDYFSFEVIAEIS
jgi:hypothetical protein